MTNPLLIIEGGGWGGLELECNLKDLAKQISNLLKVFDQLGESSPDLATGLLLTRVSL